MKNTLMALAAAAFIAVAPVSADDVPSGTYALDKTHASVTWKVSHLGLSNYTARFTEMDASITFDAANPEKSSVMATINPASVETDFPNADQVDFDAEIRGKQFFDAGEFASITFKSTKLTMKDANHGTMEGNLTFHGVTKPVTFDVTMNGAMAQHPYAKKPAMGFSAVGTVKRSEFGVDYLVPYIGDDVTVLIEAEFIAQ